MSTFPQARPRKTRILYRVLLAFLLLSLMNCCLLGFAYGKPMPCFESLRSTVETFPSIKCHDPSDRILANLQPHEMEFLPNQPDSIVIRPLGRMFVAPSTVLAHEIRFLFVPVGCHAPPPA